MVGVCFQVRHDVHEAGRRSFVFKLGTLDFLILRNTISIFVLFWTLTLLGGKFRPLGLASFGLPRHETEANLAITLTIDTHLLKLAWLSILQNYSF